MTSVLKVKIGSARDSKGRFGRRAARRHDLFSWTSHLPVASWLETADGRFRRRLDGQGKPLGPWERSR